LQLDVLGQAVEAANSPVTEAKKRKAPGKELETLTMNASIAENDKINFTTQVATDASTKKGAATGLTNRQGDVVLLLAVAAKADMAMQAAASQLQLATAAKEAALKALTELGLKPRHPQDLPAHRASGSQPGSPTKVWKPKVQYVAQPKIARKNNEWSQMIGTEHEGGQLYQTGQANKEALPVGEVIRNAVECHKFNQPCTAKQALAWVQFDDLSTGITVDWNSFNPTTHMLDIDLSLVHPDSLPEDALEWPTWLETTTIDLETKNYPKKWL
jgi:hypothetical protein